MTGEGSKEKTEQIDEQSVEDAAADRLLEETEDTPSPPPSSGDEGILTRTLESLAGLDSFDVVTAFKRMADVARTTEIGGPGARAASADDFTKYVPSWRPLGKEQISFAEAQPLRCEALWKLQKDFKANTSASAAILKEVSAGTISVDRAGQDPLKDINAFFVRAYLQAKDNGNAETAQKALEMLAKESASGANPAATQLLRQLQLADALIDHRNAKDNPSASQAALERMAGLALSSPEAETFLSTFSKSLDPKGVQSLEAARVKAASEQLNQGSTNGDYLQQHNALMALARLHHQTGNREALSAMSQFGWPGSRRNDERAGQVEYARMLVEHPDQLLSPHHLSPGSRDVYRAAANVLQASKDNLTPEQMQFASKAANFSERFFRDDKNIEKGFATVLDTALAGKNRGAAVEAILESQSPLWTSKELTNVLLKAVGDPAVAKHFSSILSQGQGFFMPEGVQRVLVAATAGRIDGKLESGQSYADAAAQALQQYAAKESKRRGSPDSAKNVIDMLLETQQSGALNPDTSRLLPTVAKIAAGLPAAEVKPAVFSTISETYTRTADRPNSTEHKLSREAMLTLAKFWDVEDAKTFTKQLTPEVIAGLKTVGGQIPAQVKSELLADLEKRVRTSAQDDPQRDAAAKAIGALKEYASRDQLVLAFGQDSPEVRDFKPVQSKMSMADWSTLWQHHFPHWNFPKHVKDPEGRPLTHHALFDALSHDWMKGTDPQGLNKLRELCYESACGVTGLESVPDWYSRTRFVDCVQRYESARNNKDAGAQHNALVDMMTLRRGGHDSCVPDVKDQIDKYLNGQKNAGHLKDSHIVLAVQESQRRVTEGLTEASKQLVNILRPDANAKELGEALDRFTSAARGADISPRVVERIRQYGTLKQLESITQQMGTAEEQKDPEKQKALRDALTRLQDLSRTESGQKLVDDFSGPEGLRLMLDMLHKGQDINNVVTSVKDGLSKQQSRQVLQDGDTLRRLPLTAQDLLRGQWFSHGDDSGTEQLRNFGALKRIQQAAQNLATASDREKPENVKALQTALKDLQERTGSPGADALIQAFGGREKLGQTIAQLSDPSHAGAALRTVSEAFKAEPVAGTLKRFEDLRKTPDVVAQVDARIREEAAILERASSAFPKLLRVPEYDGVSRATPQHKIDVLRSATDEFIAAATSSGAPQDLKAFAGFASASSALNQLRVGLETPSKEDRDKYVVGALKELKRAADLGANQDLINAFGGKSGIDQLIRTVEQRGADVVSLKLDTGLSSSPALRTMLDGQIFRSNAESLLRTPIMRNPDALEGLRNDAAAKRLTEALERGGASGRERAELMGALAQTLLRDTSASGRALIDALGGKAQLEKLKENVEESNHAAARDQIRAMLTAIRGDKVKNMLERGRLDSKTDSELLRSGTDLLGPRISAEEIARAIEGSRERGEEINKEFNNLEQEFLRRQSTDETPEACAARQEAALKALEQFGIRQFAGGGDDRRLAQIPDFRAVHQLRQVSEATTPQAKAEALRQLKEMGDMGNPLAREFMHRTIDAGKDGPTLDALLHQLERGSSEDGTNAAKLLAERLPDAKDELDNLRSRAIMRDLLATKEPTVKQMEAVQALLKDESAAGNKSAQEWQSWADANRNVVRLSARGGAVGTEADRKAAVTELVSQARGGNVHAKEALFGILASGQACDHGLGIKDRPPIVPDLSHLSAGEKSDLVKQALTGLEACVQANPQMSQAQSRALALMLGQFSDAKNTEITDRVASILDRAWSEPSNRENIMKGAFSALEQEPAVPGRRQIADFCLQHADDRAFVKPFQEFAHRASQHDLSSMYMVAGVLGRKTNQPESDYTARQAAMILGDSPAHRAEFLQAMIDRNKVAGDQAVLLATMGDVAARTAGDKNHDADLPQVVKDARSEIRRAIEQSVKKDEVDPFNRDTYSSAVKGMAALVRQWQPDDVTLLTKTMTPEVAEAIRSVSSRIPSDLQDMAVDQVMKRLKESDPRKGEWVPSLQALGHLAPYLKASDVKELTTFMQAVQNPSPQVQLALGKALLSVVGNGSSEAQDLAAAHFTKSGWAHALGPDMAAGLLKYAQGKDVDPELIGKISEVAYGAGVKPPIQHLLRTMGVTDVPKEQLDAAIKTVGGDQKFRDLLSQINAYHSLPKAIQELVRSGSNDVSKLTPEKLILHTENQPDKIDVKAVIAQLQKGELSGDLAFLRGNNVNDRLQQMRTSLLKDMADRTGQTPERLQEQLVDMRLTTLTGYRPQMPDQAADATKALRAQTMDELCKETKKGHDTSYAWWLALGVGYPIARQINQSDLKDRQDGLVRCLRVQDTELARLTGDMRRMQATVQALDLARDARDQYALAAGGDRQSSDRLLLKMANEHGTPSMAIFARDSYAALAGTGYEAWQRGAWGRVSLNGLTGLQALPTYSLHKPEVLREALNVFTSPNLGSQLPSSDPRRYSSEYLDLARASKNVALHEACRALDTHPAIMNATAGSQEIMQVWSDLQKLAQVGVPGDTRSAGLVQYVRDMVAKKDHTGKTIGGLDHGIEQIQQNLPVVKDVLKELEAARKSCTDATAQRLLDDRIESLKKLVDTFSPGSPQMQQFNEMSRLIKSGSFDETTFWRFMRDKVLPMAATIAVAAAITVATWGTATPLVIAGMVAIAASSLAIHEIHSEISYQNDWNGTRGSLLGDAIRRREHEQGRRNSGFLVYDAQSGQFIPGPTVEEAFKEYGVQILKDTLMQMALFGFGHALGAGLKAVAPGARATSAKGVESLRKLLTESADNIAAAEQAMSKLPLASQLTLKNWLKECGNQVAFGVATEATHDQMKHGFDAQNFYTHMAAAFAVCALHRGVSHTYGNFIRPRWAGKGVIELPVDKEMFMKELGERVQAAKKEGTVKMENLPDGTVRVTLNGEPVNLRFIPPETAIARGQEERAVLAEGATGQPSDRVVAPEGRPHGWEGRRTQETPADLAPHMSPRAEVAKTQMERWVEHATTGGAAGKGDYGAAAEHALACAKQLGKAKVEFFDVDIPVGTLESNLQGHLGRMGGKSSTDRSQQPHAKGTPDNIEILLARPNLVLADGTKVDLSQLSTARERLSPTQREQLDKALESPGGQAILRRMGLQYMEEIIVHGNQIAGGDKRLSYVQAEFSRQVAEGGAKREGPVLNEAQRGGEEGHRRGFKGTGHDTRVAEQEVLAMMYQAGASWSDIMAVAQNPRHFGTRENLVEYLKRQDAIGRGERPTIVPERPTLPGAPRIPSESERTNLPKEFFEGSDTVEVTQKMRQQFEARRLEVSQRLQSTQMPAGVKEVLEMMLDAPTGTDIKGMRAAAKELALVNDVLRLDPKIREAFMDPVLPSANVDASRGMMRTARYADTLLKSGVSIEALKSMGPDVLERTRVAAQQVPEYIRKHFIDPSLSDPRGFDRARFEQAHNEALAMARLSPEARVPEIARLLSSARGDAVKPLQDLMLETARQVSNSKEYSDALAKNPATRNRAERKLVESVEKARDALGVTPEVWQAMVDPVLKAPGTKAENLRSTMELAEAYSQRAKDSRLDTATLKEIMALPPAVRAAFFDTLVKAPFNAATRDQQLALARAYKDSGLPAAKLEALSQLDTNVRRAMVDPIVADKTNFTEVKFDAAIQKATDFAKLSLPDQVTELRTMMAVLETRTAPGSTNPLSATEHQQLTAARELMRQRMQSIDTRIQALERRTNLEPHETQELTTLRTTKVGQQLIEEGVIQAGALSQLTPKQLENIASLDAASRRYFLEGVLRQPGFKSQDIDTALTEATQFLSRPPGQQMSELRRKLKPLEDRQSPEHANPLTAAERETMRARQDYLYERLRATAQEMQRLEALTSRSSEQDGTLKSLQNAFRQEVAEMAKVLDIGQLNMGQGSAEELAVMFALQKQLNANPDLRLMRLQKDGAADLVGYDFLLVNIKTGKFLPVDSSARDKPQSAKYQDMPQLRKETQMHMPDPRSTGSRDAADHRAKQIVADLANSPLNMADIRLPFDQAHAHQRLTRETTPEERTFLQAEKTKSERIYKQAYERYERQAEEARRTGQPLPPEPALKPLQLPTGEIVHPNDLTRTMPREINKTLGEMRKEFRTFQEMMEGKQVTDTRSKAEVADALRVASDRLDTVLRQRQEALERYVRDLDRRAAEYRAQGRNRDADRLEELARNTEDGALNFLSTQATYVTEARELIQKFESQSRRPATQGPATGGTPPPAPRPGAARPDGKFYASGNPDEAMGTTDNTLRTSAAKRAVSESQLSADEQANLTRLVDRGPRGIDLAHRILKLPADSRTSGQVNELLKGTNTDIETISGRVQLLESIENGPPEFRKGLMTLLEKGKKSPEAYALIADILATPKDKLSPAVEFSLKQPEFLSLKTLMKEVRPQRPERTAKAEEAQQPKTPIDPKVLREAIGDVFAHSANDLAGYEYSQSNIERAKRHAFEVLRDHLPGVEPVELLVGSEQLAIVLSDRTVLKIKTNAEWMPEWGTRSFDAPMLPIGDKKRLSVSDEGEGKWIVYRQPFCDPCEPKHVREFNRNHPGFWDGGPTNEAARQLGRHKGRTVLVDYGAVEREF